MPRKVNFALRNNHYALWIIHAPGISYILRRGDNKLKL